MEVMITQADTAEALAQISNEHQNSASGRESQIREMRSDKLPEAQFRIKRNSKALGVRKGTFSERTSDSTSLVVYQGPCNREEYFTNLLQ